MQDRIPAWVNGELTPVDKLAAHRQGLRHKAVSVFVLDGARLLIQQRAAGKYHTPGLWANTCCTHPLWGEGDADCALRRLSEELGIGGLTPVHRGELRYRADVGDGMVEDEVVQVFTCAAGAGLRVEPNPAEVQAVRWVGLDDLRREIAERPERFTPWMRIYMAEHAAQIFGTAV
ncbi:isopentenyl-diphosphate Delta-isomerase [Psychromarinibacter sp. C21-152]|uniref:Isopentenyl-diphosphate Delta-isomerase n=1 Tax=Psychromarinibacter sediminicola TaxID=3033385 RepID=A0AAE3NUF9_9RHOB|nr:isopentenyl-diphosphate Delta-isomerase [Psychromarinibacter sediminicola]MDF0600797.1 isopentenyl-diphosphate Delta-isomerase [Psychromarinibacter sediminicola]